MKGRIFEEINRNKVLMGLIDEQKREIDIDIEQDSRGLTGIEDFQDIQVDDGGTGVTMYMCDTDLGQCVQDPNGQYSSYADCKVNCGGTGSPCPPTNMSSPFHTNHNEFCANCGPGAYYNNHVDCPCCQSSSPCPPADPNSPYYTNNPEFCYFSNGVYVHQQPGMTYHNHPDGQCC